MDSASNELHLTPENIRDIQELVLLITPDFREELWERIELKRAEEREKTQATVQAMQQMMNQSASGIANQMANQLYQSGGSPLFQSGSGNRFNVTPVTQTPIWTSYGTGFTPYGPLSPEVAGLAAQLDKALDLP